VGVEFAPTLHSNFEQRVSKMAAGKYDITIEQGATFSKTFTWKNSARVVISNTGYTAAMQVRETVASTTTILSSTGTSPGISIALGGALGTITVTITSTVTAALDFETAVYDLELTLTSTGAVTRLLEGEVFLSREVTR